MHHSTSDDTARPAGHTGKFGELFAGWRIILIAFVGISVGISSTYFFSLGLFMKDIAAELGLGRGVVSSAPLAVTFVTAGLAPFVGRLVDRTGPITVAFVSTAGLAVALFLLATFTSGTVSFFALVLLLAFVGAGTIPLPLTKLIVSNFALGRGMALGIALAGTGLGAFLVTALIGPIVDTEGWRAGYRMLGVGILAGLGLNLLLWFLPGNAARSASPAPSEPAPPRSSDRLLRDRAFLALAAIFFLAAFGNLTLIIHFVPMLTDAGMTLSQASAIAGSIGLSLIAGRIVTGYLLDVVRAEYLGAALFFAVAAGMILLIVSGSDLALIAAILAGFGIGAEVDVMAFLTGRYFPLARFGAAYGGLYGVFLVGSALGPAVAGYLFDAAGDYQLALFGASGALIAAAALLLALPIMTRQLRSTERAAH